jgi:hypothetical protein
MNALVIGGIILVVVGVLLFFLLKDDGTGPASATGPVEEDATQNPAETTELPEDDVANEGEDGTVKEEVSEDAPAVDDPSKIKGLTGWYTGDSWDEDNEVWKDKSEAKNDVTEVKGSIDVTSDDGSNNQKYLFGGPSAGMKFPVPVLSTGRKYSLFHVARFNGSRRGRIFDGVDNNFISGFHGGHVGTAHRSGSGYIAHWLRPQSFDDFIVHTDQKHLLRYNGLQRSGATNQSALIPGQLTINDGQLQATESSDWAVAEVIVFNRELTLDEMMKIENYLMRKYRIMKSARTRMHMLNFWRDGKDLERLGYMGAECGDQGAISFNRVLQHGWNGQMHQRRHFDTGCIQGLEGGFDTKQTKYFEISDWKNSYKGLMDMDCKGRAIGGYSFEETGDGTRLRLNYKCQNAPVNKKSCTSHEVEVGTDAGMNEALHGRTADCGSGKVMSQFKYTDEDGSPKYKFTCCALEDA